MEIELVTHRPLDRATAVKSLVLPAARDTVLTTAELSECTCPDFCERDHGNE